MASIGVVIAKAKKLHLRRKDMWDEVIPLIGIYTRSIRKKPSIVKVESS